MEKGSSYDFVSALKLINTKLKNLREKDDNVAVVKPAPELNASLTEEIAAAVIEERKNHKRRFSTITKDTYETLKVKELPLVQLFAGKTSDGQPSSNRETIRLEITPSITPQGTENSVSRTNSFVLGNYLRVDNREEKNKLLNKSQESERSKESKDYSEIIQKYRNELRLRQSFEEKCKLLEDEKKALQAALGSTAAQLAAHKSYYESETSQLLNQVSELKQDISHLTKRNEVLQQKIQKVTQSERKSQRELQRAKSEVAPTCVHESSKLYHRVLNMADELFEKNNEIKILRAQQLELFRDKVNHKDRDFELTQLREHIHTLLNKIQHMKAKIEAIVEKCESQSENEKVPEILKFMHQLKESIQKTLEGAKPQKFKDFKEFYNSNTEEFKTAMKSWLLKHIQNAGIKKDN